MLGLPFYWPIFLSPLEYHTFIKIPSSSSLKDPAHRLLLGKNLCSGWAFETGDWVKADCPPQCGSASSHPLRAWLEYNCRRANILSAGLFKLNIDRSSLALQLRSYQLSWFLGLEPEPDPQLSWVSSFQGAVTGLVSFHNHVSQFLQFLILNLYFYFYIYT